ncbi:WG repeat-containing protein [Psychroflexus sediminis]|uniref:WG containing repeat-containing protein n=1 Tax=Psychroflexus sediminis TaxID=470826 RepID=A0A1G7YLG0_9FLAO|nr:WG repeat-containing protein [Psychroflexus sediminis]SDG97079.1 WG containing repeat-containing protein [Psychroflexus sediminis]
MAKFKWISCIILMLPFLSLSQTLDNLDYVSPFHEDLAAVQKNDRWAFIDREGAIVIDYRSDLVENQTDNGFYPLFSDGRCLIEMEKEGISYFGYIDTSGNEVIVPQFLNAKNFKKGKAIVLQLIKEVAGENKALGKKVVYYNYFEVLINKQGDLEAYLSKEPQNIILDESYIKNPPKISYKQVSESLFIKKNKSGKSTLVKIE